MRHAPGALAALLLPLSLGACDRLMDAARKEDDPLARATRRGQASLTIIACPQNPVGGNILTEYLNAMATYAPLVVANDGATARVVINTCPFAPDAAVVNASRQIRRP